VKNTHTVRGPEPIWEIPAERVIYFDMQLLLSHPRQVISSFNSEMPARSHLAGHLRRMIVALLLFFQLPVFGEPADANISAPLSQKVNASSALLVDAASGRVLFSKNPTAQFPPASTTKLLTGLIVYEHTQLEGNVVVEKPDTMVQPSSIPLKVGETVSVRTLVQSLLIGSDNDSAMALARFTSGSVRAFVALMNARARELGCRTAYSRLPTGCPRQIK
jgi:D-alanyl-D-alanine carboxypeptidase